MHCDEGDQYQTVRHPDMRNIGASLLHFLVPDLKIYRKWGHMKPERSPNMIRSYGPYGTRAEPKYDPVIFGLCLSAPNFT